MKYTTIKQVQQKQREEKDLYVFKHQWLWCVVKRHMWHLNWYVALPEWSPYIWMNHDYWIDEEDLPNYKEDYLKRVNAINEIRVHGWLTFGWEIANVSIEGIDLSFCFGFDTAHCGDFYLSWIGGLDDIHEKELWDTKDYRDAEYVIEETKKLAKQIKDLPT